jgi:hypothetical protein
MTPCRDEYISIIRRSPYNLPDERRRYVALKAYYDGSGKSEPGHEAITLAGIAASEQIWPQFEEAWGQALRDLGFRFWHTTDMNRWMTEAAFDAAVVKLLGVIGAFRDAPITTYAATVILDDYNRAETEIPSLKPPEALCVDGCVGRIVIPTEEDFPILLCFDRGEEFLQQIKPVWLGRRARFERDWSRQISDILDAEWQQCRPLQAADLLAWSARRYERLKRQPQAPENERQRAMERVIRTVFSVRHYWMVFDYDTIKQTSMRSRAGDAGA